MSCYLYLLNLNEFRILLKMVAHILIAFTVNAYSLSINCHEVITFGDFMNFMIYAHYRVFVKYVYDTVNNCSEKQPYQAFI